MDESELEQFAVEQISVSIIFTLITEMKAVVNADLWILFGFLIIFCYYALSVFFVGVRFFEAPFCLFFLKQIGDPRCCINTRGKKQLPCASVQVKWWRNILNSARMLNTLKLQETKG